MIWLIQPGFWIYSKLAGIKKVTVPIKKAIAVTIIVGYLFKIFLEIVAPITKESEAKIIKMLPISAVAEKLPKRICGIPIIIKAPKNPKAIPKRLIR